MSVKTNKRVIQSKALKMEAYTKERGMFKAYLLQNPNYFGNIVDSKLKPLFPIAGNTYYEELGCLGYHPQQKRLEGVVYVYQPSGYGTDICGPGTPEYVRFYLSFDNGATWQDQGMTSFQAYNISRGHRGWQAAGISPFPCRSIPKRKFCWTDPLIQVRAILSWNNPPPANQPNWNPVWGNVREATILVEPLRIIFPPDLFEVAKVKYPPWFEEFLPPDLPIQTKPKVLSATELAVQYKGQDVPVHRFAFKELSNFVIFQDKLEPRGFRHAPAGHQARSGSHRQALPQNGWRYQLRRAQVYRSRSKLPRHPGWRDPGEEDLGLFGWTLHVRKPRVRHLLGRFRRQWQLRDLPGHG